MAGKTQKDAAMKTRSRYLEGLRGNAALAVRRALREGVLVITEATAKDWPVLGAGWRHHVHKSGGHLVEADSTTGRVCWMAHDDAPPLPPELLRYLSPPMLPPVVGRVEFSPDGGEFTLADRKQAVGFARIVRDILAQDRDALVVPWMWGASPHPITVEGVELRLPASQLFWLADALGKLTLPDWLPVQLAEQAKEAWRRWCRRRGLSCLIEE